MPPNRLSRQSIGMEISQNKGQRWLCARVIARVGTQPLIVVDGLRFLEDRAFFIEIFGPHFLHLHIVAPREMREKRYLPDGGPTFAEAVSQAVEREVASLGDAAMVTVDNLTTKDQLAASVTSVCHAFMRSV